MELMEIKKLAEAIKSNISRVIVGKDEIIDLLLISLICSGHVLVEDVPGTGKTMLAKSLAQSLDCSFKRIQFTPDLLPSDISGINYFNQKTCNFQFRPGPVFTNILLADEINRATPRTQSSLLECMEERQVSIDGETRALDSPFMVVATQNPVETLGTFPLPEAQLDRFLIKIQMGYPSSAEGVEILRRFNRENPLYEISAVADAEDIRLAQKEYVRAYAGDDLLGYIVAITERTRKHPEVLLGVSPRGSQALLKTAQARAILKGRDYVTPDDVKAMSKPVLGHRIIPVSSVAYTGSKAVDSILEQVLSSVPVPSEDRLVK